MNVCRHVATERSAAVHVYRLSSACIAVCTSYCWLEARKNVIL